MLDPAALFLEQAAASPHVHFIYDLAAQRVVFVNAAYERVLQGHRAQVDQELPALLARLHPEDRSLWLHYWQLWTKGQLHDEVEVRLLAPDGAEQWLCLTPYWHQTTDGQAYVSGTLRDSTASQRYQQNSDKFNAKKNTVLEILAHDLSGAFIMLQQLTEYVQQELEPSVTPSVAEMLELMQRTSRHSVELVHDLIDQEFLAASEIPLKRERVDLGEQVTLCLEPFRRTPGHEGPLLKLELPQEPVYAEVDVNKLLQVVSNIVVNARKFTSDQGRVTVRVAEHDKGVRISIADEGIGIPAHLLPVLFERFTPARRPGLRGEPTTGLGLSLCKLIVELHGGTLTVASNEGQGTTFTIDLPSEASN